MKKSLFCLSLALSCLTALTNLQAAQIEDTEIASKCYFAKQSQILQKPLSELDKYYTIRPLDNVKDIQFVGLNNLVLVKPSSKFHQFGLRNYDEILFVEYEGKQYSSQNDILKFIDFANCIVHYRKFGTSTLNSFTIPIQQTDSTNGRITCIDNVCTMTIHQFNDELLYNADFSVLNSASKIIFDVRDSPGGQTRILLALCDLLFPQNTILFTEKFNSTSTIWRAENKLQFDLIEFSKNHQIEVLKNNDTRSCSEIFIGILKHNLNLSNLTLHGDRTYGKFRLITQLTQHKHAIQCTKSIVYFDDKTYDEIGI